MSAYRQVCAGILGDTQNVGYMVQSGPIGLIFGPIGIEFQGAANYGIIFAPHYDFHAYLKEFEHLSREQHRRPRGQNSSK